MIQLWPDQPYWFQRLRYNIAMHNFNLRVALLSGYPQIYRCTLTTTEVDLYCSVANCFKFDEHFLTAKSEFKISFSMGKLIADLNGFYTVASHSLTLI